MMKSLSEKVTDKTVPMLARMVLKGVNQKGKAISRMRAIKASNKAGVSSDVARTVKAAVTDSRVTHYLTKAGVKFLNEAGYPQLKLSSSKKKQLKHSAEIAAQTPRGKRLVKASEDRLRARYPNLGEPTSDTRAKHLKGHSLDVTRALNLKGADLTNALRQADILGLGFRGSQGRG